jgi:hypothetical protein
LTRGPSGLDPRPSGPRGRLAGTTPWPTGQDLRQFGLSLGCHMAWSTSHHLAPNQPLQVDGGPIHPYKYPLTVKVDTPHSFCGSPLVKVPV